jgi:nicotinamide-nucleotide amidase
VNAEIIAVGTELLLGQIVNTNAQYISQRLPEVGVNVYYHNVVGDNPERLKKCLGIAMERSDVIILTGGLGPTKDDLTKETVAGILEKKACAS